MYADESRIKDIQSLKEMLRSQKPRTWQKKQFRKTLTKIQAQLKDKQLSLMRERLIKAHVASDRTAIWKISNQIRDYVGEETIDRESMV